MQTPQLIEGMSFADYLADPCPEPSLTASLCRAMLSTAPRRVWEETFNTGDDEGETKFDLGTAAHALFTGTGNSISVINAKDYRSNDAKEQRAEARVRGWTPVLAHKLPEIKAMVARAWEDFGVNRDIGPVLKDSLREATIIWSEAGIMCRCRPDFYHAPSNTIIHYKTTGTSVAPNGLSRFAAGQGWDITAAHYAAGVKALTGRAPLQFFAVQEVDAPYLGVTVELDRTFLAGAEMRHDAAVNRWARCVRENIWPGFPSNTIRLECPEWHERNLIADKDAEEAARHAGTDLLDMARRWQAPEGWRKGAPIGRDAQVIE